MSGVPVEAGHVRVLTEALATERQKLPVRKNSKVDCGIRLLTGTSGLLTAPLRASLPQCSFIG